jgi:hypothetical protein
LKNYGNIFLRQKEWPFSSKGIGVEVKQDNEVFESHPSNEASASTYGQDGCKEV